MSYCCVCVLPVSLEVFEASLQIIEQVDLFAALGTVDIHHFTSVMLTHLTRSLACTVNTHTHTHKEKSSYIELLLITCAGVNIWPF